MRMLQDRNSSGNIVWGTDSYTERGPTYATDQPIQPEQIFDNGNCLLLPRSLKLKEVQKVRQRKKAEVFTPSHICKEMTELLYQEATNENRQGTKTHASLYPHDTWEEYIDATVLEITCGEAPFLVSRYDTTTNEPIPVKERYGLLDRKLQRIRKDNSHNWWFEWVVRAYLTTYGYELQGDNLFLARQNMLFTFIEYSFDRWDSAPTETEIDKITDIIVWNIWQMNGLTGKTPPITRDGKTFEIECTIREPNGQHTLWKHIGKETPDKC